MQDSFEIKGSVLLQTVNSKMEDSSFYQCTKWVTGVTCELFSLDSLILQEVMCEGVIVEC